MGKPLFRYHSTLILKVARLRGGLTTTSSPRCFIEQLNVTVCKGGVPGFLRCFGILFFGCYGRKGGRED